MANTEQLPIEAVVNEVKTCIAQYANGLCNQYELPPVLMIQIMQEIVYENRLNSLSTAMLQLKAMAVPIAGEE